MIFYVNDALFVVLVSCCTFLLWRLTEEVFYSLMLWLWYPLFCIHSFWLVVGYSILLHILSKISWILDTQNQFLSSTFYGQAGFLCYLRISSSISIQSSLLVSGLLSTWATNSLSRRQSHGSKDVDLWLLYRWWTNHLYNGCQIPMPMDAECWFISRRCQIYAMRISACLLLLNRFSIDDEVDVGGCRFAIFRTCSLHLIYLKCK